MSAPIRLVFVLPSEGGGGGANSVVQEALGFQRIGISTVIASPSGKHTRLAVNYPELLEGGVRVAPFESEEDLGSLLGQVDICCATTNQSVELIHRAIGGLPSDAEVPRCAYYVQDYEPLFYEYGSSEWRVASDSYKKINNCIMFAKTKWICDIVYMNHGVRVERVEPSIDHSIFYPNFRDGDSQRIVVSAMLRPKTPRRAPLRTARTLGWIAATFPKARIDIFGASDAELVDQSIEVPENAVNHGRLKRTGVPEILRRSDLFLDLSDYQAFGRTALEAMASGSVPVVPLFGGADEYANHGVNSFVVDTRSDSEIRNAIRAFLEMSQSEREAMRINAIETASRYSVTRAVASELKVFTRALSATGA